MDYTQAIEINPENTETGNIYEARGQVHMRFKDYDAAIADLDRAIQLKPNKISALEERAKLHEQLGDKQAARKDWENIAQLYQEQGDVNSSKLALENIRKLQE